MAGTPRAWLAHLAPVRGASPFNGSGTAVPFNGSGSADWRVPTLGLGFEIWEICAELYQLFLKFSRVDFMD